MVKQIRISLILMLVLAASAQVSGQTKGQKALKIAWGDGQTTYLALPQPGQKSPWHVHPVANSQYSAIKIQVSEAGKALVVEAFGLKGNVADFSCQSIKQMQQEALGTYTLSPDTTTNVKVAGLERQGVLPFELAVVDSSAVPLVPCPTVPPGCCGCPLGGGQCTVCCPQPGHCLACGNCGACCL